METDCNNKRNQKSDFALQKEENKAGFFLTDAFGVSDIKSCSLEDFYSH